MKKVFLGVGHGGSDPGAVAGGFLEKDVNLSIALACYSELVRHGVAVRMSRTRDEEDSLEEEIRKCNEFNPDLALDIHNNAGGGDGAEAFYHVGGGQSKALADHLLSEISKLGQNIRGAKTKLQADGSDWYGFIRETVSPAVIVECAFLDHPQDVKTVDTEEKRIQMGIALAKGILATLGIPYRPLVAEGTDFDQTEETEKKEEALPAPEDPVLPPKEEKANQSGGIWKHLIQLLLIFLRKLVNSLKQ